MEIKKTIVNTMPSLGQKVVELHVNENVLCTLPTKFDHINMAI